MCPVDASGRFTEEVTDFKGLYVKVPHTHTHVCRDIVYTALPRMQTSS